MNKIIKCGAIVLVLVAIAGAYLYPKAQPSLGASASGNTYNSAKNASIVMAISTPGANATSSSILNTDSTDRLVTGLRMSCAGIGNPLTAYTGAGLASWQWTVGTSSTASPASLSSTFPVANALVVATTTPNFSFSSTTAAVTPLGNAAIWHSGEYMSFTVNATTTGNCTVGVDYLGS